jgi:hypothetical protein
VANSNKEQQQACSGYLSGLVKPCYCKIETHARVKACDVYSRHLSACRTAEAGASAATIKEGVGFKLSKEAQLVVTSSGMLTVDCLQALVVAELARECHTVNQAQLRLRASLTAAGTRRNNLMG